MRKLKVKNLKFKIVVGFLFAVATISKAQNTEEKQFSLQQAIDFALQNQTNVLKAGYDEEIAKDKVKEIVGIGLPQINGSFDVKDFLEIPTNLIPAEFFGGAPGTFIGVKFGTKYNATAGIDASQLLFSSDYLVGLQATKTYLELTRKAAQRTRTETSITVSKAYYTVLVNDERIKLIDANVARLKKLMDDTKVMNDNGFVEKIDVDRINLAYNNLTTEREKISKLMQLSLALLKYQMGMDQTSKLTLTDKLSDINFTPDNISAEKFNYSNRIEYSLFESSKRASELQLKKEKLGYLPNLVAYGALSANALRNEFDIFDTQKRWYPTAFIGVRLGVPIFDGLQRHYRIQQSKLSLKKAEADLKFMQQSIDLELSSSIINLQNATSSLETQKKNIVLAEEVYKVSKLKYEQGVGSNLEVLTAETSLKEAQTNYFNALFDALVAKIDYQKASGALTK